MRGSEAGRTNALVLAGLVRELAKGALDVDGLTHLQLVQRGADEVLRVCGAHSMAARVCLHMAEHCYAPKETQAGQLSVSWTHVQAEEMCYQQAWSFLSAVSGVDPQ